MTLSPDRTVRLSTRDWVAIGTLTFVVLGALLGAFLHHDRLLVQVVTQQGEMSKRLDRIEANLERKSR